MNLIIAAGDSNVRHFVPSEFQGSLSHRTQNDPLDRGSAQVMELLRHLKEKKRMGYTVFSCGIFMETFHPQGLGGYLGVGYGTNVANPGSFLLDMNSATAEYAERNAKGRSVRVCLTSVHDLVRFIVAAVDLGPGSWPKEYTLRGDRMTVRDLVGTCSLACNGKAHAPSSHTQTN